MDVLKQPEALSFTGNVDVNWKSFKQRFDLYLLAIGAETKSDARKNALLLTCAGQQAMDVYNTLELPDEVEIKPATGEDAAVLQGPKYETVLKAFDNYCAPKTNETYERYIFRCRRQKEGETFDSFVTDLKLKGRTCDYGEKRDSHIRDQIVYGVLSDKLRERLLRTTDLTLAKSIEVCKASEISQLQMSAFTGGTEAKTVHGVTQKYKRRQKPGETKSKPDYPPKNNYKNNDNKSNETQKSQMCNKCGSTHLPNRCPAHGKVCNWCKNYNHFSSQCIFRKKKFGKQPGQHDQRQHDQRGVHVVQYDPDSNQSDETEVLFCGTVESNIDNVTDGVGSTKKDWTLPIRVNNQNVITFKVDTGAQVNLIPINAYRELKQKPEIQRGDIKLTAYNGTKIPVKGTCQLLVDHKNVKLTAQFVLVEENMHPVLGLNTSENLGIVKRVDAVSNDDLFSDDIKGEIEQQYKDLFTGIGCLPVEHTIRLKEGAIPSIDAERKVSAPMRVKFKEALDKMVKLNVIKEIDEPTPWVSSPVMVRKKNGDVRVCLDPQNLNNNILREHYHIPLHSELTCELANAKYFSKLDAKMAFWQIPLDKESQKLCTFGSPFGRYCYLRLPYGITSASEVFHKSLTQMFDDLQGVKVYVDDLIVWGVTKDEHDSRLKKVLDRARQSNLVLNAEKCEYRVKEIKYLGEIISDKGVHTDPDKVEAVKNMRTPQVKTDLQRFFGTLNYLRKFIPNLASESTSLRSLLENRTVWSWNHEHQLEWDRLKQLLIEAPVLKHFDLSKATKVATDASNSGLGAALFQLHNKHWYPVAYASRALTEVETRYAPIEKETLGLVFGCQKFEDYIYGKEIILETDHKPLLAIHKKPLASASPRIQRLMLKLLRYDVELQWTPGKDMHIPDTLSRAYLEGDSHQVHSVQDEVQEHVDAVMESLPFSKQMWSRLIEETNKDEELQKLRKKIEQGWQSPDMRSYFHFRDELAILNGVILKGTRIVVPKSLRAEMLERIHEGHLGIEKCRRRARTAVYWPGINEDIEEMTKQCASCQRLQYQQGKETLIHHQKPQRPWAKLGADLYHYKGREYLLVMDYYSNYPETALLEEATAECVINHMKSIFARHGIPHTIISDNGPQFDNHKFREFASKYGFDHTTSSPGYAQSNGLAETGVKIVKRILKKCEENQDDPYLALLNYRTSPLECGKSPAELLMNRSLRTRLPRTEDLLYENAAPSHRNAANYDRTAKDLKPLQKGDTVRIRRSQQWEPMAKVLKETDTPRSYIVQTESGSMFKRNRKHLLKTGEKFPGVLEDRFETLDMAPIPPIQVQSPPPTQTAVTNTTTLRAATTPNKQTVRQTSAQNTPVQVAKNPISSPCTSTYTTKSGRQVNVPSRYKD